MYYISVTDMVGEVVLTEVQETTNLAIFLLKVLLWQLLLAC